MTQRKILASLSAAVISAGLSAFVAGCQDDATRQVHGPSRPVYYGTDGNRGVSAPSAGVPQNTSERLGGELIQSSPNRSSNGVVAGSAAGVDPPARVPPPATTPGAVNTTPAAASGTISTGADTGTGTISGSTGTNRSVMGETSDGISLRGGPVTVGGDPAAGGSIRSTNGAVGIGSSAGSSGTWR